jgi:hypothetical protein
MNESLNLSPTIIVELICYTMHLFPKTEMGRQLFELPRFNTLSFFLLLTPPKHLLSHSTFNPPKKNLNYTHTHTHTQKKEGKK